MNVAEAGGDAGKGGISERSEGSPLAESARTVAASATMCLSHSAVGRAIKRRIFARLILFGQKFSLKLLFGDKNPQKREKSLIFCSGARST